jgi:hypothetical protein
MRSCLKRQTILRRNNHVFEDVRWVAYAFWYRLQMFIYIVDYSCLNILFHKFNLCMMLLDS